MTLLIKNFTKQKLNQKYLDKVVQKTLKIAGFKKPVEISLVILGKERIRSLNKKYRNINKITDVLSFGNEEAENKSAKFISPPNKIIYLGEIFICYPQARKQAIQKKHSIKRELSVLLIHGILHLLGYDHKKDYKNSEMKTLEEKVLESL
ncbi:MAG: rRNA maturation RNase YbeY [Candidatus Andersenbacteria bacterium]|nr:rRNA maturation RNase YbeY [Candidatus Andersenbacteria bacterium]